MVENKEYNFEKFVRVVKKPRVYSRTNHKWNGGIICIMCGEHKIENPNLQTKCNEKH